MQFIDYKSHLQELLDLVAQDTFVVSDVRDMGTYGKVPVVITALAGSVYTNSATIPYQIEVMTDDPDAITNVFTQLAKTQNGKSFISMVEEGEETKEYTIFEFFSTPSVVDKQDEFKGNNYVRLILFVTLNVLFEVGNISKIEIDGNEIEFINGTLNYTTENFSNRVTGENLNKARKKASTTNIQLTMVNRTTFFTNKIFDIVFGNSSGNTIFEVKVTLTNGIVGTLNMVLGQNVFSFAKNSANLPTLNVTLNVGDNRGN